jgi:hypothetical protein
MPRGMLLCAHDVRLSGMGHCELRGWGLPALGWRPTGFPSWPPPIHSRCAHLLVLCALRLEPSKPCAVGRAASSAAVPELSRVRGSRLRCLSLRQALSVPPSASSRWSGAPRARCLPDGLVPSPLSSSPRRTASVPRCVRRGATRAGERSCHCLAAGHAPLGLLLAAHSPSVAFRAPSRSCQAPAYQFRQPQGFPG